jgi:hypothetical protein
LRCASRPHQGLSATRRSSWAGDYRSARFAIDGDSSTFWSDDGLGNGTQRDTPAAATPFWLRVELAAAQSISLVQLVIDQDMTYAVQTGNAAAGPWTTQATRACTVCVRNDWPVANRVQVHAFAQPVTTRFIQIAISYSGAAGAGACGGCTAAGVPNAACTSVDFCSWCVRGLLRPRGPARNAGAAAR